MTNKVIITEGKYGRAAYDADDLQAACALIIKARMTDGYYNDEEAVQAQEAIEGGRAYAFLRLRKGYEYEGFELLNVERAA